MQFPPNLRDPLRGGANFGRLLPHAIVGIELRPDLARAVADEVWSRSMTTIPTVTAPHPLPTNYGSPVAIIISPLLAAALFVEAGGAVNVLEPLIWPRGVSNLPQSLPRRARQIVAHGVSFSSSAMRTSAAITAS